MNLEYLNEMLSLINDFFLRLNRKSVTPNETFATDSRSGHCLLHWVSLQPFTSQTNYPTSNWFGQQRFLMIGTYWFIRRVNCWQLQTLRTNQWPCYFPLIDWASWTRKSRTIWVIITHPKLSAANSLHPRVLRLSYQLNAGKTIFATVHFLYGTTWSKVSSFSLFSVRKKLIPK